MDVFPRYQNLKSHVWQYHGLDALPLRNGGSVPSVWKNKAMVRVQLNTNNLSTLEKDLLKHKPKKLIGKTLLN